jgi:MFS family permease
MNTKRPTYSIVTAMLFFCYAMLQMSIFNSVGRDVMTSFHLSGRQLSTLSSWYFYANTLWLLPAGWLLDKFPIRPIFLAAVATLSASTLWLALSTTYASALAARVVTGVAGVFGFLVMTMAVQRFVSEKKVPIVMSLGVAFGLSGCLLAQTPLTALMVPLGWRMALVVDFCIGGVLWLVALRCFDVPSISNTSNTVVITWSNILRNRHTWLCGLFTAFMNAPLMVLGGLWGNLYWQQMHALSALQAASLSSIVFLGTIAGTATLGYIMQIIPAYWLMLTSAIGSAVCIACLCFQNLPILWCTLLAIVLGLICSMQSVSYTLIMRHNQAEAIGRAMSLSSLIIMTIGGLSQQLFGILLDWPKVSDTHVYTHNSYRLALFSLMIASVFSIWCAYSVKKRMTTAA